MCAGHWYAVSRQPSNFLMRAMAGFIELPFFLVGDHELKRPRIDHAAVQVYGVGDDVLAAQRAAGKRDPGLGVVEVGAFVDYSVGNGPRAVGDGVVADRSEEHTS